MKILYFITKSNWGGAQKHVYDLAVYSHSKGHQVLVALGGNGELNDRLKAAGIATEPISTLGRDIKVSEDAGSFKAIWGIIHKYKPDILHLHSPKAAGLGALAGRLLRTPKIVYTVHGWTFNEDRSWQQKATIYVVSWLTALLCHRVIVISQKELMQGQTMPFITNKLRLIYPGIHSPNFAPLKESLALFNQKTKIDVSHKKIIGTISELHTNKGLTYFINGFAENAKQDSNLIAIIIGEGEERPYLESLILEKNLADKVFFVGQIPNAANHIKAFDIFFLSSIKEGLSYVILEAGWASLPVIATAVGGNPEIIDDMSSGILIQAKKSSEITHAIEFMLKHQPTKRGYGTTLHKTIVERFSIETMLALTEKVYGN